MAKSNGQMSVTASEDLEYCYRDVFKAFVGEGEVLLEFANVNRSDPSQITIRNRIALSIPNTVRLIQHLQNELKKGKERFEAKRSAE